MDIERLNKIKQICFGKNNQANGKRQPLQSSKSPMSRNQKDEKENAINFKKPPMKEDPLKKLELEVTQHYERKHKKLEQNMQRVNEKMRQRRESQGRREVNYTSISPQRNERSQERQSINQKRSPIFRSNSNNRERDQASPFQIKQRERSFSPYLKFVSLDGISQSFRDTSQFGGNEEYFNFSIQEQQLPEQVKKLQSLLNQVLNQVSNPAQKPLIPQKSLEQMRLRLNGAFESLVNLNYSQNPQYQSYLSAIIEGFLRDINQKLQSFVKEQKIDESDHLNIKNFLLQFTQQVTILDVEQIISKIVDYAKQIKLEYGCNLLSASFIRKQYNLQLQTFQEIKRSSSLILKKESFVGKLIERYYSRFIYQSQSKSFAQWKYLVKHFNEILDNRILSKYISYFKDATLLSQNQQQYSIKTKEFIEKCLNLTTATNIDIFYFKNGELYTFQEETDEPLILDQNKDSLLKSIIAKRSKYEVIQNATQKKTFNQDVDIPFIQQRSAFLKQTQNLVQIISPIYSQDKTLIKENRKLTILIRLSISNQQDILAQTFQMNEIQLILSKISPLVYNSFKSFKKINHNLRGLYKMENNNQNQISGILNDKLIGQLQYLQQKSLELSCFVSTIPDCFNFIQTIVKELFNYEKCNLIQYQNGQILKLYDRSDSQQIQKKPKKENQDPLYNQGPIGYTEYRRSEADIREMIQQQIENSCNNIDLNNNTSIQIKQKVESEEDKFEMERKKIIDYVLISLESKQNLDLSTFYALSNTQQTSMVSHIQTKYFLRFENTLEKAKDQEQFIQKYLNDPYSSSLFFKQFCQLILIAVSKLKLFETKSLNSENQPEPIKQDNENILDISKISQINEDLRQLLKIQKQSEDFFEDLRAQNQTDDERLPPFEELSIKIQEFIQSVIPSACRMQLFLIQESDNGQLLYTYVQEVKTKKHQRQRSNGQDQMIYVGRANLNNINPSSSFQCTSRFQSTLPIQVGNLAEQVVHLNQQNNSPSSQLKQIHPQRPKSQINLQRGYQLGQQQNNSIYQQPGQFAQLDDISSISGDATHNMIDKNSMLINNFIDNQQNQSNTGNQRSLTRQPSINLCASSSSTNLRNQIQMIHKQKLLNRDHSARSELQQVQNSNRIQDNQQVLVNFKENTKNNAPNSFKRGIMSQDDILISENGDGALHPTLHHLNIARENQNIDESVIVSQNNHNQRRVEFFVQNLISEIKSLVGYALQKREPITKKNTKNDKRFNPHIDNLMFSQTTQETAAKKQKLLIIENSIFIPLIGAKQNLIGLIQIGNCDKNLAFTEQDQEILRLFSRKLTRYLEESKESHFTKLLFKKQLEVSVLNSSLENQSVTTILSLANNLFQQKTEPLKAVHTFITKTEKYLANVFNCNFAQILVIDHLNQSLISLNQGKKTEVIKRADFNDTCISMALIKGAIQEPAVWPVVNDYILIGDANNKDEVEFQFQNHSQCMISQLFHQEIDSPLGLVNFFPQTYLALCIRQGEKPLAVVQLLQRHSNFRFTDQDLKHLAMLCDHMAQIFEHIATENYLYNGFSDKQLKAVERITKIVNKRVKVHKKEFFREILAFKYGKINLLKNKIVRKFVDRHMKVDQILVHKLQSLINLKQKQIVQKKKENFDKLKQKIKQVNDQRQKNALKCLMVFTKYEKLLSIRVKDTVFKFWDNFKKQDLSSFGHYQPHALNPNNSSSFDLHELTNELNLQQRNDRFKRNQQNHFHSTFNMNNQSQSYEYNHENTDALNQSSILEESSVTSTLYQRAKAVYKMRKLYNKYALKPVFDCWIIKVFVNSTKYQRYLFNEDAVRLLKLHHLIKRKNYEMSKFLFRTLFENQQKRVKKTRTLKKLLNKKHNKTLSFGIKVWHNSSENSVRYDLKQEKSYTSQLTEQYRESQILQLLMMGLNNVFSPHYHYKSLEDTINSLNMKQLFCNLCEFLGGFFVQQHSIVITFKLPDNYHIRGGPHYALFSYPSQDIEICKSTLNQQVSYLSSINQIGKQSKPQVYQSQQNLEQHHFSHFSSISESQQNNSPIVYNEATFQPKEEILNEKQPSQPFFVIYEGSQDIMLQQLQQTKSSIFYGKLQDDRDMKLLTLKVRRMQDQSQAMIIPMIDKSTNQIQGTLEIYQKCSQLDQSSFTSEDQLKFQSYANLIQIGIDQILQRLYLIQNVSIVVNRILQVYNLTLDNELLLINSNQQKEETPTLSLTVQNITRKIQETFKADHCLLFFITETENNMLQRGRFYNFDTFKLYDVDFRGTFLEKILEERNYDGNVRHVTFPSSLVTHSIQAKADQQPEFFETFTGQTFEAIKYIPVMKSQNCSQILLIIEVGWQKLFNANLLHDNDHYLQKKENLVKSLVQDEVEKMHRNLKLFTFVINKKLQKFSGIISLQEYFIQWKRLTLFTDHISNKKAGSSSMSPLRERGTLVRNQINTEQRQITSQQRVGFNLNQVEESPMRSFMGNLYFPQSNLSVQNPSAYKRNNSRGHSRKISNVSMPQSVIAEEMNLEVEKAAKRKLISAALMFIAMSQKTIRIQKLRFAFQEWRNIEIVELGFNQLLMNDKKHQAVRFTAAVRKIERISKKLQLFAYFTKLRNAPRVKRNRSQVSYQRRGSDSHYISQNLYSQSNQESLFKVGNETHLFEDDILTMQELESQKAQNHIRSQHQQLNQRNLMIQDQSNDDVDSEFSLGNNTQMMIHNKADWILQQARSEFKQKSYNQH